VREGVPTVPFRVTVIPAPVTDCSATLVVLRVSTAADASVPAFLAAAILAARVVPSAASAASIASRSVATVTLVSDTVADT
jgi:hypothetical protein